MRQLRVLCLIAAAFGLACSQDRQAVTQEKKAATIKITVPEKGLAETELKVNDAVVKGNGATRTFTTEPLEPGKEYKFKIEGLVQPNNYTKITRTREVAVKAGDEVKVELTTEDKKTDKIVVRWVPTPNDIVDEMAKLAKIGKDDVIFDPGCGDAVMLIRPVKQLGAKKGIGIDIDPMMVVKAQKKAKDEGVSERVVIKEGDILNEKDMAICAEASVVLIYIGDDLGARMSPVLQKLLKPGTRIVSHRFKLGDWAPDKTVKITGADGDQYTLHYWEVKAKK
jgi:uncharacterized protein (TIGR03000 family)